MNNRQILYFLLTIIALASCKVQKSNKLNTKTLTDAKTLKKSDQPVINSLKTNYLLKDSTTAKVFMEIEFLGLAEAGITDLNGLSKRFKSSWVLQPSTGIKERLAGGKISFEENTLSFESGILNLSIEIPRQAGFEEVSFVTDFADLTASRKFTNEALISFAKSRVSHWFGLYEEGAQRPSFSTYVKIGQKFSFKSLSNEKRELYLRYYSTESKPALSPMSTSKRNELGDFSEQKIITINSQEPIQLTEKGTYVLFNKKEVVDEGFGFVVVDEFYPRLTQPEDLTKPLVYMSTNEEIKVLSNYTDIKEALDLYFLNMTQGNQGLSKRIIRTYYRRIEKANQLFTTYKEGWQTDKGMIYTILGAPSRVQKSGNREVWLYSQSANFSEIIFTFYNKPNQFSKDHYELVRYPEYGAYWYPFVEAWRTGNVLE